MQTTKTTGNSRKHHIWHFRASVNNWICVLCGAVSTEPTKVDSGVVHPRTYEELTDQLRQLAPPPQRSSY